MSSRRKASSKSRRDCFVSGGSISQFDDVVPKVEFEIPSADPEDKEAYWEANGGVKPPRPGIWNPLPFRANPVRGCPSKSCPNGLAAIRSFCRVPEPVEFRLREAGEVAGSLPEGYFTCDSGVSHLEAIAEALWEFDHGSAKTPSDYDDHNRILLELPWLERPLFFVELMMRLWRRVVFPSSDRVGSERRSECHQRYFPLREMLMGHVATGPPHRCPLPFRLSSLRLMKSRGSKGEGRSKPTKTKTSLSITLRPMGKIFGDVLRVYLNSGEPVYLDEMFDFEIPPADGGSNEVPKFARHQGRSMGQEARMAQFKAEMADKEIARLKGELERSRCRERNRPRPGYGILFRSCQSCEGLPEQELSQRSRCHSEFLPSSRAGRVSPS
ncbi:hypothetical protein Bca52824_034672 [Brassica carinata]|uniref:Uncharacterized protein n=1 Tax=Brassica carinata TaxID=52824 RepID=A0A8X7UZP5_BRACI|nr:hypothetical protein Bca52824_034672 [Brassica carinata]